MTAPDDATRAQNRAADPSVSTWLAANAGSGKTKVLTDRVARLLLAGVLPQRILCLTYTKAAASEMQNRLFRRLGGWAMLDDRALADSLADLGMAGTVDLSLARTLFARAIETPGGLKIQTIHSFCAGLLRQFPLEAGVSPQFRELDDAEQSTLIEDVLEDLAETHRNTLVNVGRLYSGQSFVDLARDLTGGSGDQASGDAKGARELLGVAPYETTESLFSATLSDDDMRFLASLPSILRQSTKANDLKLADGLERLSVQSGHRALEHLESLFLTGPTATTPFAAKIGAVPTKDFRNGPFAPHAERLNALMLRIETTRDRRLALDCAMKSEALQDFADAFLPAYRAAKSAGGVIDFDDLIKNARDLLTNVDMAWVLFRLDGGIDHILVDEAQDTSPAQWAVIAALAEEVTAGQGARDDVRRTLFVVGDKKQSIYSFQGADARAFDAMENEFSHAMAETDPLHKEALVHSFRSAPAILTVVDAVFTGEAAEGLGDHIEHRAFHDSLPGRVDLWDLVETEEGGDDPDWHDPVDRLSRHSPKVRLAQLIAANVESLLKTGTIQGEDGHARQIRGGDVLILVQRRSALFDAIIRECKSRGLPVAGADRLRINAELAVRDLLALLSFLSLPDDDLALATALRSPVFGWSEAQLYDLAHTRSEGARLWQALRYRAEEFPDTHGKLLELRRLAEFKRPFELLQVILIQMHGRRAFLERLGLEAEDGIDELLNEALAFEATDVPNITTFVAQANAESVSIKRESDTSGDLIRIMTVHGAKGLEAPVVILPDTIRGGNSRSDTFLVSESGTLIWNAAKKDAPPPVLELKDKGDALEREEDNRLLYVAMTRAAQWLIVAGAALERSPRSSWYATVKAGMEKAGAVRVDG
ncbi:MAG: double-strand break repair helicase AddA, partial [Pseudomonadota bacterium]